MTDKYNKLSHSRLTSLMTYNPKTGDFYWIGTRPGATGTNPKAGCINQNGYSQIKIDLELYLAHRLAWFFIKGEWPIGVIDHINNNKLDNRIENLRVTDMTGNARNCRTQIGESGLRGVTLKKDAPRKKKYQAIIRTGEKREFLGHFETAHEAALAYDAAAKKYHGEFAVLNFA